MSAKAVIMKFTGKTDTGNEYKFRYAKEQKGQREYGMRLASLYPTPPGAREGTFQRNDEAVARAFNDAEMNKNWREAYGLLPADSLDIINRWLLKMLKTGDDYDLMAASCFLFASRSTIEIVPTIEEFCGLLCACWITTEKTGMPRLIPLPYNGISKSQYERLAFYLPLTTEWSAYPQVNALFNELKIPNFSRKANLPRVMLIGLLDKAQWQNPRFDALMAQLPRGRADLFNLALGHISRSFLVWAYMGMAVKEDSKQPAAPAIATPSAAAAASSTQVPTPPTTKLNLSNLESPTALTTSTVYSTTPSSTTSSSPWVTPKQLMFTPLPDYLSLTNSPIDAPENDDSDYAEADRRFVQKLFYSSSMSNENSAENE